VRFKITPTVLTAITSAPFEAVLHIGAFDADHLVGTATPQDMIAFTLREGVGGSFWDLRDTDGAPPNITAPDASSIDIPSVGMPRFVELSRTSATTYQAKIYLDSAYSDLIDIITGTCSPTTDVMPFVGVKTNMNVDATAVASCDIDDLQVWNGTSTLTDWESRVKEGVINITNRRIDWTMIRNGVDNRVVHDLQKSIGQNADDSNWTLRFRYHINAGGVQATVSGANQQVLLQDTDVGQTASNDVIGWSMQNTAGIFGRQFVLLGRESGASSGFTSSPNAIIPFGGDVDLFVEIIRTSPTTVTANVYTDSAFTELFNTLSITTSSANIGLRYIVCSAGDQVDTWDGTETGFIDNIEFYNGVSQAKAPVIELKDFEDRFWEDNWADTGTQHAVNTATQVIDWDSETDGGVSQTTFDLETIFANGVNPTKWGLRFKFTFGGTITVGGAISQFAVYLTSAVSGTSSESAQDHATWKVQGNPGAPTFSGMIDDATQIFTGSSVQLGTNLVPAGGTGYGEMVRNGDLWTWAVYSDSDFTQLLGNKVSRDDTGISTVSGLRFLKVGRRDVGASVFSFNGTVDDIQFWNGDNPTEHGTKWVEVNLL